MSSTNGFILTSSYGDHVYYLYPHIHTEDNQYVYVLEATKHACY